MRGTSTHAGVAGSTRAHGVCLPNAIVRPMAKSKLGGPSWTTRPRQIG